MKLHHLRCHAIFGNINELIIVLCLHQVEDIVFSVDHKEIVCVVVMKLMNIYFLNFVLILILFNCRELDAQIGMCNLNTIENANNICSSSSYLVYISESVCESSGGKNCLCILVDNRNREYDGQQMEIEMDHSFRVTWMRATRADLDNNSLDLKFIITPGINQIFFEPYTSLAPINVVSLKINGLEVCKSPNRQKKQIYIPYQEEFYVEPNSFQFQTVSQPKLQVQNTQGDYRFLNDCMQRRGYTANSEHFCHNDVSDFTIEKRYLSRDERYWCVSISNENNVFNSANRLKITYSSRNKFVAWAPSDSYIQQNSVESNFHLGGRRTIVAVSVNNGELSDITSVTVDGHSLCNYFQPQVTAPPPPRTTTIIYRPPVNSVNDRFPVHNPTPPQYEEQPIQPQNKPSVNENCGIKPTKRVTLISYGLNTSPGDWPWHAAIYKLQSKTNRNYICGGTLIDRKTVITAAHCVLDLNLVIIPDRIIVELGRYDLSMTTPGTQEFKVYEVKQHELYNPETIENDIAILVLANYVQVTAYVNFICLPEPNMDLVNQVGKTVGWGRDQNNELQTELKEASVPVVDNIMCLSSNRDFFGQFLTKTNFCAGYRNNTNVCRGDSGGGLVFQRDNHWILGGITSLGVSSKSTELQCDITQYAIFTDVTKFVKWIKQNA